MFSCSHGYEDDYLLGRDAGRISSYLSTKLHEVTSQKTITLNYWVIRSIYLYTSEPVNSVQVTGLNHTVGTPA
jgi:hypothetical protein